MKYDPEKYHRHSIRLKEYDYSQAGGYFITVCAWGRECLFGEIVDGKMRLNGIGEIVENEWLKTPALRSNVFLDEYLVMPNHFHGIVMIEENRRGEYQKEDQSEGQHKEFRSPSQTIGAIVRGFKSSTAKHVNEMRNTPGAPVWQRNYYEHIVRNEKTLDEIREYIRGNPMRWAEDEENPADIP